MSTALSTGAPHGRLPLLGKDKRVAIVTAEWNSHITGALTAGAVKLLQEHGVGCDTYHVPGAVELTFGTSQIRHLPSRKTEK